MGSDEKVGTVDWGGRQRCRLPGSARVCSAARASIFHDDWGPYTCQARDRTSTLQKWTKVNWEGAPGRLTTLNV